jgi:phosphohistidine phosphatase SixA
MVSRLSRRSVRLLAAAALAFALPYPASASEEPAWAALRAGGVLLLRHALAPGTGDPPGFRLGDCSTQRTLDDRGRAQARAIGAAFRARGLAPGAVLTSQWCRARDTADLAFPGRWREEAAFNSFFEERSAGPAFTARARAVLAGWRGPGPLVVVTHQVNVTGLTGIVPASGEGVALRRVGENFEVAGRIRF